jgi:hypothetical protein
MLKDLVFPFTHEGECSPQTKSWNNGTYKNIIITNKIQNDCFKLNSMERRKNKLSVIVETNEGPFGKAMLSDSLVK